MSQDTGYPWDGSVRLTIEQAPQSGFALMLRIPGWVRNPALKINGRPGEEKLTPGDYVRLEREWKQGDVVELELPMPARKVTAHPLVEESRAQVCIMRGPVVYCLESTGLPEDTRIDEMALSASSVFTAEYRDELLGGSIVLTTNAALKLPEEQWRDALYRDAGVVEPERTAITLIPYFAWSNRGPSEMSVWIPYVPLQCP